MIRGFFFDLDGTLVDTHYANYLAYRKALRELGVNVNFAQFKKTIGLSAKKFLPQLAPGHTPAEYQAVAERKAAYYKDYLHRSTLNTELIDFIRDISKSCKIVLVTTAKTKNLQAVLKHHGIEDIFDLVVSQEDVAELKPHPEAYLRALSLTGLKAEEVVAFEDSESGISAAKAAGIPVISIKDFRV